MTQKIGSLAWAEKTQGTLTTGNKLAILSRIIAYEVRGLLIKQKVTPAPIDLDSIRIPDSPIAKKAMEHSEEVSPLPIFLHCMRTYTWGMLLAGVNHLRVDEELFFVMAQLHDLGLVEHYHGKDSEAKCFAVEGSRFAGTFCTENAWPLEKASEVEEAISLHLNVDVAVEEGVEAHLLRAGSGLDVIGARKWEIARETRQAVIKEYPREDFVTTMNTAMQRELIDRPHSRISFLYRFGFGRRMVKNRL